MRVIHAIAIAVALPAGRLAAQPTRYDVLSFAAPKGWKDTVKTGMMELSRHVSGRWSCAIGVYESRPSTGSPAADFAAAWNDLAQLPPSPEPPASQDMGNGWTRLSRTAAARYTTGENYELVFATFSGNGRRISVVGHVVNPACRADVTAFVASVRPREIPIPQRPAAQPVAPPIAPAGSTAATATPASGAPGVWRSIGTSRALSSMTNAAGTGFSSISYADRLRVRTIAVLEDGSFAIEPSNDGLLDYIEQRQRAPDYWGRWTLQGGVGTVTIGTSSGPIALKDGVLTFDGNDYRRVPSSTRLRFQGTFSAERSPDRFREHLLNEPTIAFGSDGTFSDRGAIYWVRHVRGSATDKLDANAGTGTYEIQDYTITFSYSDGRRIRLMFLDTGEQNRNAPRQIRLGTSVLLDRL